MKTNNPETRYKTISKNREEGKEQRASESDKQKKNERKYIKRGKKSLRKTHKVRKPIVSNGQIGVTIRTICMNTADTSHRWDTPL